MSRVVNFRMSEVNLVQLYEMLQEGGAKLPTPTSPSIVASAAMKALISTLSSSGQLRLMTDYEAKALYQKYFERSGIITVGDDSFTEAFKISVEENASETVTAALPREKLREMLEEYKDEQENPDLTVEEGEKLFENVQEPVRELKGTPCPWEDVPKLEWKTICNMAPKDRMVQFVQEVEQDEEKVLDPLLVIAIEMIYSVMSVTDWGGAKAVAQITELQQEFNAWKEANDGE